VTRHAIRVSLALLVVLGQLFAMLPDASAASTRITAKWTPTVVDSAALAGVCPTPQNATAACQINRGATYKASAQFALDQDSDSVLIDVDDGGLGLTAISRATGADYTPVLKAGQTTTIDLTVTIPDVSSRRDRTFYLGKVKLSTGGGTVAGSLTVSVNLPSSRIAWTKQNDPKTGDRAPITTIVGSGTTVKRDLGFVSNVDVTDFGINVNTNLVTLGSVPGTLAAGQQEDVSFTYTAPTVTRRTTQDVVLRPIIGGVQALEKALRIRIVILPAEVSWSPPQIRETLTVQQQKATPRRIFLTSNYDVAGVRFKTADLGLSPVVSPLSPVNLKAGVPQPVDILMCPGYAPTTYFIGITAYQGSKPLNKRLPIRMKVQDNGEGLPKPGGADPCQ
jgi:hypothetical protein